MSIPLILTGLTFVFLTSCTAPSTAGGGGADTGAASSGRDALGHRPGPRGFRTVVIDAGHGGKDSGAVSAITGAKEKDLTLDVARRVQGLLPSSVRGVLMRNDDSFVDLDDRVARASRMGDVLVSIHFNSGPSHLRGTETFFWRVDSYGLGKRVQSEISALGGTARGLVRRRVRLTRNPEIPCILTECGYLSHPAEARQCSDPAYRQRLAQAIVNGIMAQQTRGDAGVGALPPPINAPLSRPTDARE